MPSEFHFLRPAWLWLLPAVIAAAVLLARRQLSAGSWASVVAPTLAPYVLSRSPTGRDLRWWLTGAGGILAVLALAGPVWQRIDQPVFRSDQSLVIALDLSRSMDAQDVSPSRLLRARLKILDMLERRGSGQTALVVYSANAFTVTPLTTDNDTIAALVNSLGTDIMPSRGSYPASAIHKGRQLLEQAGAVVGEVLLITDGGASAAAESAARDLRDAGYTLSVMAVGTPEGAPIPLPDGGFVTGPAGEIAVPRTDERSLRRLAAAGGGRFTLLTIDDSDIRTLLSDDVAGRRAADGSLATDQWREEGPWLLLALLPIAALAFRRGWVLVVALALLPLPRPAEASFWDDLWWRPDQQAQQMLEADAASEAASLFENPDWRAVAEYRAKNYAESAATFAEHGDVRNLYNLGNALARQGELASAIDAYEQVLEIAPDDEDAAYNRDLLQQLLEQQQQEQQGQGDQQQSDGEPQEGEQQGESSDSENEQQDGQQSQSESGGEREDSQAPPPGEQELSEEDLEALQDELRRAAEEAAEQEEREEPQQLTAAELEQMRRDQEQQQAMEQWLRRIPDDPGGLLRNKFRQQYQKLERDQDGRSTWPDDEVQPW